MLWKCKSTRLGLPVWNSLLFDALISIGANAFLLTIFCFIVVLLCGRGGLIKLLPDTPEYMVDRLGDIHSDSDHLQTTDSSVELC